MRLVTQMLGLGHKALVTLRAAAVIGDYHVEDPQTGRASPLGAALKLWLAAVLAVPDAPPPAAW